MSLPPKCLLLYVLLLMCSTIAYSADIGHFAVNKTFDMDVLAAPSTSGSLEAMLSDIALRLQQRSQEQRLDSIQQLNQQQLQQQQLMRQTENQREILEQLRQLRVNVSVQLENLHRDQTAIQHNISQLLNTEPKQIEPVIIGCFRDTTDRDLPAEAVVLDRMTHQFCAKHCASKEYKYAGVQDGIYCFCGHRYGRHGASNNCIKPCPGDSNSLNRCGGVMANTILRVGLSGGVKDRILMQQHYGGTNFFSKTWVEFKSEFGSVDGNYWIGNERLHRLTSTGQYSLRIDMLAKSNNQWYWAEYRTFRVYDEASGYTLNIAGYTGNAGDALSYVNGRMFSTKDKDQDTWANNCAADGGHGNGGGFWYHTCAHTFPNSPIEGTGGFGWYNLPIGSNWPDRKLLVIRMTLVAV